MSKLPTVVPSVDRIVEMHARGMEEFGGLIPFRVERSCLESALGAAVNACLYNTDAVDPDDIDPLQAACYLFAYINTKQCFSDGTKRAAWLSLVETLSLSGLTIEAGQQEAADFTLVHAKTKALSIDYVVEWVTPRLKAFEAVAVVSLPKVPLAQQ